MDTATNSPDAGPEGAGPHMRAGGAKAAGTAGGADRDFLSAMIPHHEAAIDMARDVIAKGADPAVRALAEAIVAGQGEEIGRMREMLASLPPRGRQALMAALPLPAPEAAAAPDWVHLLPAGEVRTRDGRGPYTYDAAEVIAASMAEPAGLVIDQDHATDLAAPTGREAPARGWIEEMQARADGVWARVAWTASGAALLADRAYRGLSPVIVYDEATKRIRAILRASLVNAPNLRGLTALHAEDSMDWTKVAEALGLPATATADEAAAVATTLKGATGNTTALHSTLAAIGTELGVEGGDGAAILVAAKAARAGTGDVVALQARLTAAEAKVKEIEGAQARAASEAYVDGEMAKGRVGLNATTRPDLVALHMAQPDAARRLIDAMPVVGPGAAAPERKGAPAGTVVALNATQKSVCHMLGIPEDTYLDTLKAEAA
mgnify:CR=1 FL=1